MVNGNKGIEIQSYKNTLKDFLLYYGSLKNANTTILSVGNIVLLKYTNSLEDKILFIFDELKVRFDEKHIPKNVLIVKEINKENLQKDLFAENEISFYNVDKKMCYSNGFVINMVGGKLYHNKNKMFFSKFTLLKITLCFVSFMNSNLKQNAYIALNFVLKIKAAIIFDNIKEHIYLSVYFFSKEINFNKKSYKIVIELIKIIFEFLNTTRKSDIVKYSPAPVKSCSMKILLCLMNYMQKSTLESIKNIIDSFLNLNKDNNTNGNNFEKENISIDAPFDNCLDKSIEDEDSYSSTEYNGIASNVLHKTMVLVIIYERIEINIILSISNNLSNNKITSLDFGSVGIVIKNELMNNNDEHGSDSNNYYFDRTTEYCIKFEPKLLRFFFIYDRFNYFSKSFDENIFCAAMLTDIVYLCELICRNPEKYSTEMFKSLENLTNYSNDNLEYKNTYFKYLERLLEYITTENSDFSPLFEIFAIKIVGMLNSKIQINKSSLENLYFISEANIDFHGISLMFEK
uniref:Uncharacterized protein n=1 Tax=Strongyloides stercoralis TaxID=6248 RepID=A0AAF5DJ80_STRER